MMMKGKRKNMDQQTWVITFHTDSIVETSSFANELTDLLQDISRHVKVTFIPTEKNTQSAIGDTIIAFLPSSVMIAAINAIKQFFLRNHQSKASIELEIKGTKFKATMSEENYKYTLDELLKYAQTLGNEEK